MSIQIEDRKICVIDGVDYTVVYQFNIAHIGWECDYEAYIVKYDNEYRLVVSTHGRLYMVDNDEISPLGETYERKDVMELQLQVDLYRDLINDTNTAIEYLTGRKGGY